MLKNHPGVKITPYNSVTETLFEIDRSTNNIQVGNLSSGTIKIGGKNLELYTTNEINFLYGGTHNTVTIISNNNDLSITKTGKDIKIAYGMQFEDDENNLTIKKPGSITQGVKIP
jgi:hypothetical protein